MGVHVHLGDAAHEEVLVHAGLADVCMAVVTVPDSRTAAAIIGLVAPVAARFGYRGAVPIQSPFAGFENGPARI